MAPSRRVEEDVESTSAVSLLGQKVCKHFPKHGWFEGKVIGTRSIEDEETATVVVYRVKYEDGDVEEMERHQVECVLANPRTLALVKARREKVRAALLEDDGVEEILETEEEDFNEDCFKTEEEDFEEEEKAPAKRPRKKSKSSAAATKKNASASNKKNNTLLEDEALLSPQKRKQNNTKKAAHMKQGTMFLSSPEEKAASPPRKRSKSTSSSSKNKNEPKNAGMCHQPTFDADLTSPSLKAADGRSRRAHKAVVYKDDNSELDDDYDDWSDRKKPAAKKRKAKSTQRKKQDDDDESSVAFSSLSDDEEMSFDTADDDQEENESPKIKPKSTKATAKKGKQDKKPAGKKKMCDSFEPINYPYFKDMSLQQIQEEKEFLDPCGMEATDDIIDRLVGDQIDKIGALLQRTLSSDVAALGSLNLPLQLGTACSGTDAPSLALTLVQEQMELRGLGNLFHYKHTFSCENDPFKQAYLARNFDSILYPDIAKLTDENPRDVFGQEQEIPPFNLFVAGTSCKNFSMLRSNRRIDIEDKGCSGETFLAATEVLFKEKPSMAIFENVIGAPWAKMQEYITGRIKLSECDSKKAVKEIKNAKKELMFSLDKEKKIIVEEVPAVYGVRCGAVVAGFVRPGSNKVIDVDWPTGKGKLCSLSDLMKANKIKKETDTLVFQTECLYCTHTVKVDTKDYGLPQTRQRTYMLVWKPDDDNINDDLGEYWESIVNYLKSPVRHSLQAFILQVDHDIIRVFREALRGPPGRQTARGVFLEPDFWQSANANLPHNKNVRAKLGMRDTARFLTNWEGFGKKQIPPHYWLEYLRCNYARQTDLLDILHASAMRDAEAHDSSFASFYWNISQNASKEKHRSACPGIAGCITPGGDFFLPQEGRPILGCEKLMIQGIPYFRLALGNETEVQLGDLAGNAMSLTVVCATMLGAITCKQLRRETLEFSHRNRERILSTNSCLQDRKKMDVGEITEAESVHPLIDISKAASALPLFCKLASLAPAAVNSSIFCTCETSGSNSLTCEFLECKVCRVSCCRNCICATSGYNLESHDTVDVHISADDHSMGKFQSTLRQIVPPSIVFNEEGVDEVAAANDDKYRVSGLSAYKFSLHRIKRDRRKWYIIYYARDRGVDGVGDAVAEFRITVGEMQREEASSRESSQVFLGMKGELTSFFPAKTEPLLYGSLDPCAVVTVHNGSKNVQWRSSCSDTTACLLLEGEGAVDSFRVEVGLTDEAATSLAETSRKANNAKHFAAAKKRNPPEERRWLYPENWKVWPQCIHIKDAGFGDVVPDDIFGIYKRAQCRQTTNQSALWIKEGTAEKGPSLYIVIKPNINRTGPDKAIVTRSISHSDSSSVIAILPFTWQPCDALSPKFHMVKDVQIKNWKPLKTMACAIPASNVTVATPKGNSDILVSVSGLDEIEMDMLCRGYSSKEDKFQLNIFNGQKAQQTVRVFSSVCVVPILKYVAEIGLKYDTDPKSPWIAISPSNSSVPFGCCETTIPVRPSEEWYFDEERKAWERRSKPGASRKYYLELQAAPQPFELWLQRSTCTLSVKCFPEVVAHRAAVQLIEGRGDKLWDEVSVNFRLSDVTQQRDPVISPFKVSNCDSEKATTVGLKNPHKLYDRQQKVVTKMLSIEDLDTEFEELEMSEQEMPGCGLSLIAKATRNRKICGGVIADAIGSGKTVISIAMILNGLERARASRKLPNQSGATLVAVPNALIDQWSSEIRKFAPLNLKVIKIYDHQSLIRIPLKDVIEADVVICPIDILEANGYMEHLIKSAEIKNTKDAPKLPSHSGQIEQTGARGVWIPASSADPYEGGNNANSQKRRNQSAYFTFVYLRAVQELRKKEFQPSKKGVPLEYFQWERVIVDEIHESLCTTKSELNDAKEKDKATNNGVAASGFFKEKNRRAGRELLGITQKDVNRRPLIFRRAIFGLTGTPLLDSTSRVTELANLMGNSYIVGLSSHWRKLERESCRDIFLHNYLEPKQSREMRTSMYNKCQDYLDVACCRNKTGEEMAGIELDERTCKVKMTEDEKELYMKSQSGIPPSKQSFAITPEEFDVSAGHDISKFLRQNASFSSRGAELVRICKAILGTKGQDRTKIIVFVDGRIGAGASACKFLKGSGLGCTWLDSEDSVEMKNKKIAWYQTGDATPEDRARPRVLVLNFEHAAGLNLQTECHNVILYTPLYIGEGLSTSDPVSDASTELQSIGRVYRPGQTRPKVYIYRIEVQGPNGEDCLDGQLIRRNTDPDTIAMAVNASE